jgi:hypothetical protein
MNGIERAGPPESSRESPAGKAKGGGDGGPSHDGNPENPTPHPAPRGDTEAPRACPLALKGGKPSGRAIAPCNCSIGACGLWAIRRAASAQVAHPAHQMSEQLTEVPHGDISPTPPFPYCVCGDQNRGIRRTGTRATTRHVWMHASLFDGTRSKHVFTALPHYPPSRLSGCNCGNLAVGESQNTGAGPPACCAVRW